jgi:predicted dehydrogenase
MDQKRRFRMTGSKPLSVALVGCGAVSSLYYAPALQALEKLGQLQVSALFDPNVANATFIHKSFPGAKRIQNFDELSRLDLDLAIVASPPQFHAPQTVQLLRSGVNVMCEKPMALTVAEGEAMVTGASESQRLLAVGLVRRFMPAAQTIHDIVSHKSLGEVKSFYFSEGRVFRWPVQSASYFKENGVLRDIGVHVLDLLIHWFGEPEELIYEDDAMGGVELNCRIRLKFAEGIHGEVRLSRDLEFPNSCLVHCSNGQVNWQIDETDKVQIYFKDSSYVLDGQLRQLKDNNIFMSGPIAAQFDQCFLDQLKNVIAAIRGTEPLAVSGRSGLLSLKAINHCYSNRKLMDMPWLAEQAILLATQKDS